MEANGDHPLCGVIPAKAGIQYSAASPRVTGSPAFERVKKLKALILRSAAS